MSSYPLCWHLPATVILYLYCICICPYSQSEQLPFCNYISYIYPVDLQQRIQAQIKYMIINAIITRSYSKPLLFMFFVICSSNFHKDSHPNFPEISIFQRKLIQVTSKLRNRYKPIHQHIDKKTRLMEYCN